jgi:hypothetical protein
MSLEKPRFRRDLEAVPFEADGERYVEVRDVAAGWSYCFYDFEYRVALALDGLPLDKVTPWVKLSTGLELQVDQLQAFVERLQEMGFLEGEPESMVAEGSPAADDVPTADEVVMEDMVVGGQADQPEAETSSAPSLSPAESTPSLAELRSLLEAPGLQPIAPSAPQAERRSDLPKPSPDLREPLAEVSAASALPEDRGVAAEAAPPAIVAMDSTAFPVLPAPRSPAPEVVSPEGAPASGPLPWTTPRPLMTPVPVTFGPIVEQPSSRRRLRRSMVLFGSLGVLAAVAMLALVLPFLFSAQAPPKPRVRTLAAAPGTIFRYFDGAGVVTAVPGLTLKFPASGKVIRLVSTGSAVASGDVAAAVEAARPLQEQLTRQRERLAFHQQMAEAMHQVGNTQEEEKQAAKVELLHDKIAKTLRALADVAVVVEAPGVVEETFAREGDVVVAGSPALLLHAAGFRAAFEFPRQQTASARRLGFCQIEAEGYLFDCVQIQESSDETHVGVEISAIPPSLVGKAAHLARARFEGAFALPLAAVVHAGSRDEVLVVSRQSRIESRAVTVAERDASEAIVVQGLDAGDNVVLDVAPGLRAGAQVVVLR